MRAQSPQPLLLEPVFLNDEKFGRHLHFVLPRFRAIAGEDGIAWLTAVAQIKEHVLLHEALKALVIGLDSTSKHSAQRRYCADVLSSTRLHLLHHSTQATHSTVMLTFLLSFHELLVWNNAKSWMMHLWGMSQFVRAMGPQAFTSPLTRMTFRWFRHFSVSCRRAAFALWALMMGQVPLDLFLRRRSFLAAPEWISEPWLDHSEKDLVDTAIDVLVHIPGLNEMVDLVVAGKESAGTLEAKVTSLIGGLHAWQSCHLEPYCLLHYSGAIDFSHLVRSLADGTLSDPHLARAIVLHLSTWLLLTRVNRDTFLPWSAASMVNDVLSICDEYSYHQQGAGILPWTFAIRVALFTDLGNAQLSRGSDLCNRLESRYSVNMLSSIIGSLPGPNTRMQFQNTSEASSE